MMTQETGKLTNMLTDGRWRIETTYTMLNTEQTFLFCVDELSDLHDIVEQGPDFNALKSVHIEYAFRDESTINEGELAKELIEFQSQLESK